jgi:hypothetical protein
MIIILRRSLLGNRGFRLSVTRKTEATEDVGENKKATRFDRATYPQASLFFLFLFFYFQLKKPFCVSDLGMVTRTNRGTTRTNRG